MFHRPQTSALLALVMSSTLSVCAFSATVTTANVTITTETTSTDNLKPSGSGTITIEADALLSPTTGNGILVDASGTFTINIDSGATIQSDDIEAVYIKKNSATFTINNEGSILQHSTSLGDSRALRADKTTTGSGTINNGTAIGSSALIEASNNDAMRLGNNITLNNYGTIQSTGVVNTKDRDGTHDDISAYDGVAIDAGFKNTTINNYGTIIGPRHGIDIGEKSARTASETNTVINYTNGTIIGKNGSGVGSDGDGIVTNHGLISGRYAGAGNIFTGNDPTSLNGDGDGVDIDGIATITNYGRIEGLGAGGVDSDGNPNGADGIAAGGGTIINHTDATIYGQSKGILIDDGANGTTAYVRGTADAAGAAAAITNSGTITAEKKTAIGLVGDYADTITNNATGVITGGKDSVRVDALASTTAAAAIQMGGGNDILTNYGTIEGKNNMAIDMGDGDDTLSLLGGSVIGTITGGSGTNTLILGGTQHYNKNTISNFQNLTTQDSTVVEAEIKASTTPLPFTGTVVLADGTSIKPIVKGSLTNGSSHTIISATSLSATAAELDIIDDSVMFDYSLEKSGNDLNVIVHTNDIKSVVNTKIAPITNVLQNLGNSDAASAILEKLSTYSTNQELSEAIKQLSPDISNAALQASINAQGAVFAAIGSRMGNSGGALASAQTGLNAGDDIASRGWVQLLGSSAKQDARKGADGYSVDTAGIAIGYERDTSANAFFGITGGYTGAKSYGKDSSEGDSTEIDSFHAGIYYSVNTPSFTLDSALVGSYNTYNGTRQSMLGTALSDYDGFSFGATIEGGIPMNLSSNWNIKPLLGAQYSYNTISSYEESGTADALHVDDTDSSSLRSVVGAEFTHTLSTRSHYTLGVRYLHEFASAPSTTAGFIGTGTTFTVDGVEPPREALQLGLDYQILTTEGKTLSAGYHAEFKDQYLSHQLALKMVF